METLKNFWEKIKPIVRKKWFLITAAALFFLLALGLTLYPLISSAYSQRHASEIHTQYSEEVEQTDTTELDVEELVAQYDKLTITEISIMAPVTEKCWKDESDYESYIKKSGVYVCVSFDINRVYLEQSTENQVVALCNDMEDEDLYFSFTFRGADNCYITHEPGTKMPSNSSIRSKLEEAYSDKA